MKNDKLELILALKALGVDVHPIECEDENNLKEMFTEEFDKKTMALFSADAVDAVIGGDYQNSNKISDILVNHNMQTAYELLCDIRENYSSEISKECFELINSMFMDPRKVINFTLHCYVEDVKLPSDVDFYNTKAVFNWLYTNESIIDLYMNEYMNETCFTPLEYKLFRKMMEAILHIKQHPELLAESYE